jgi:hypothetical protein
MRNSLVLEGIVSGDGVRRLVRDFPPGKLTTPHRGGTFPMTPA